MTSHDAYITISGVCFLLLFCTFLTSNLVVSSVCLAGRHRFGAFVATDVSLQLPADRQVVGVFASGNSMIFTLQGAEVKLVATFRVTNMTVVT